MTKGFRARVLLPVLLSLLVCLHTRPRGAEGALRFPGARPQAADDTLARLMALSASTATVESASARSQSDLAARATEQAQAAQSYRSWLVQRDFLMDYLKPRNFAYVEWRFQFARPGRFHVRQSIHEKEPLGEMKDERISIGRDHYLNAGSWMRAVPEMAGDYDEMNRFLGLAKFVEILRTGKLTSAGTTNHDGRLLTLLEYDSVKPGNYQILAILQDVRCRARLWIDSETGLLAKGELLFRGKDGDREVNKLFEQAFTDYNQPLAIDPPALKK
jgi:hypothetical protein